MPLSKLVAYVLFGAVARASNLDSTVQGKAPAPSPGPPPLVASEDSACKSKKTCEECLAVGSGCKGWRGDSCCSEEECNNAADGNKNFFVSCDNFRRYDEFKQSCASKEFQDNECACVAAGCVYQDPGGCAAMFNPAAGDAVSKTACSEPKDDKIDRTGIIESEPVAAPFCPDSPEQLCRRLCPPTVCALPSQCAMRIGNCCAIACMPNSVAT
mmetsp:Transcript_69867/g.138256  ORF Transcript_69867/g.138256 Transcript_69867/m.138256 type:complete len:213 (-) Transcript_69867:145-783(-)